MNLYWRLKKYKEGITPPLFSLATYLRFPGTDLDNFPDFVAFAGETPARKIRIQLTSLHRYNALLYCCQINFSTVLIFFFSCGHGRSPVRIRYSGQ